MRKTRLIGLILALILVVSSAFAPVVRADASSSKVTNESIKEKEDEIKKAKDDIKNLKSGLSDIQKLKKELEKDKNNLESYVTKLDQKLEELEQNIASLETQITNKETEIEEAAEELEEAEQTAQDQYDYMVSCIRYIYEAGSVSAIWQILFTLENFADFLNQMDYMNRVQEYNQGLVEEYEMNSRYVELCKEELEVDKELLDEQKKSVQNEQAQVEALIEEKRQQIISYETDISNQEKALKELEQEIADQNALMEELEKQVAEEKERLRRENQKVLTYDGGMFKFPLATYTRVSDDFGNRIHPTLHVPQFHNGVDLASPKGTAIYAAYDGQVVAATKHSTMGNYVMIDHGDGLYTVYMHASVLYVSKGDMVKRGDTIAAVGMTGRATGYHLHFGVRKNGVYVSPWDYLKQ